MLEIQKGVLRVVFFWDVVFARIEAHTLFDLNIGSSAIIFGMWWEAPLYLVPVSMRRCGHGHTQPTVGCSGVERGGLWKVVAVFFWVSFFPGAMSLDASGYQSRKVQ